MPVICPSCHNTISTIELFDVRVYIHHSIERWSMRSEKCEMSLVPVNAEDRHDHHYA